MIPAGARLIPDPGAEMERVAGLRRALPSSLKPDQLTDLVRECVTIVRPGEVLVVRVPEGWTPGQLRDAQENIAAWTGVHAPAVKVLLVHADGFAVMSEPGGPE